MTRGLARAALAAAILLASPAARADDDVARARELFVEGAKLAEAGKWDAARVVFERSLQHKRAAITLYNLGVAQQESGRVASAVETFRAFLDMPAEPATSDFVAPVRAVLPKLVARAAHVELTVRPAGAAGLVVRIDGREVPASAGDWMVDPGRHEIVAGAPGVGEVHQTLTLAEGGRTSLVLTPAPPATTGPAAPPSRVAPLALGITALALFAAGQVTFSFGAARGPVDVEGHRMMFVGDVVMTTGAVAAGVALVMLLARPPAGIASGPRPAGSGAARVAREPARLSPWASGSVAGLELRF